MFLSDHLASGDKNITCLQINQIFGKNTAQDTIIERINNITAIHDRADGKTFIRATINLMNDTILGHINKTTGQITRIGCFQGCIGKTFPRTMCRVEIFQNIQAFFKGRNDWCFDNLARRLCHQTTHAGKLFDLCR